MFTDLEMQIIIAVILRQKQPAHNSNLDYKESTYNSWSLYLYSQSAASGSQVSECEICCLKHI
jgi:hypothetical protein